MKSAAALLFAIVTLLLLIASVGAAPGEAVVHEFDSGGAQKVIQTEIKVPGAASIPSTVTLRLRVTRQYEGGAENTGDVPSSFLAIFLPYVEVAGGFDVQSTLPIYIAGDSLSPFDGSLDYSGSSGLSYSSGADGIDVVFSITDPALCASYVGPSASIPISFAAGYSASWGGLGGSGTSRVYTAWSWSGSVSYQ